MEEIKEFSNSYVENQRKGFISAILCRLNVKDRLFVREYVKDFAPRRAAEASGFTPDDGNKLIEKPIIKLAIDDIVDYISDNTGIDAEWIMTELADNHRIARQQGNISASNTALKILAQLALIDAMANKRLDHLSSDGSMTPVPHVGPETVKQIAMDLESEV